MQLSDIEARPGYTELLRELIRSQILHLVEQLSGTGEESFVVSATKEDDIPHLFGSAKGLGYMKGFTGVQEGFPHYLQKISDACTTEKNTVSWTEKEQYCPTQTVTKSVGTSTDTSSRDLNGLTEPVKTNADIVSNAHIEKVKDETHVEGDETFENQSHFPEQEVVQEKTVVDAAMSNELVVHIESVNGQTNIESDKTFGNQFQIPEQEVAQEKTIVDAAIFNERVVHRESVNGQSNIESDKTFGNQFQIPEQEVAQEQTLVDAAIFNELVVHRESVNDQTHIKSDETLGNQFQIPEQEVVQEQTVVDAMANEVQTLMETQEGQMNVEKKDTDHIFETRVFTESKKSPVKEVYTDISSIKNAEKESSAQGMDQTETNDTSVNLPEEVSTKNMDSDDEDSDLDYDEGDFDEMAEEEIFPKLISNFEDMKKGQKEMDICKDVHDKNGVKNRKDINAETDVLEHPEELEVANTADEIYVNAELVTELTEPSRESINKENIEEVKVLSGSIKRQEYRYKDITLFLTDTFSSKDLICTHCKRASRSLKELKEHEGTHTKKYVCYKCDKDFKSLLNLRAHNVKCFAVPQLVKDFVKTNLDRDFDKTNPDTCIPRKRGRPRKKKTVLFECETCWKKFMYSFSLKKHICKAPSQHRGNSSVGTVDKQMENLAYTKADNSGEVENLDLETSDKPEKENGDQSSEENNGQNTWTYKELLKLKIRNKTCPVPNCKQRYPSNSLVIAHLVKHTSDRPFKCCVCKKTFRYKNQQRHHEKIIHGRKPHRKKKSKKVVISKQIFARRCSAISIEGCLQKGVSSSPDETADPLRKSQKVKQIYSPSVNALKDTAKHFETSRQKTLLNKYSDQMLRKYQCPHCEKRYLSNSHLSEHIVLHTGEKTFKCSLCGLKLLRRSHFPRHKERCELDNPGKVSHMIRLSGKRRGRKQVSCADSANVDKVAQTKTLKPQTSLENDFAKAKKCEISDKNDLVKCSMCSAELKRNSLRPHMAAKHLKEKLYCCVVCGERFSTKQQHFFHMKRSDCYIKAVAKGANDEGNVKRQSTGSDNSHKKNNFHDGNKGANNSCPHRAEPCSENVGDKYMYVNNCEKTDNGSPRKENQELLVKSAKEYKAPQWLTKLCSPVPYICTVCDERFSTAVEILDHKNKQHDTSK